MHSYALCAGPTFVADPNFVSPRVNYTVTCPTDAIDNGHVSSIVPDLFDLDGDLSTEDENPALNGERRQGGTVDIGAFEFVPEPCGADTNDDQVVDVQDLLNVLGNWGACSTPCPQDVAPECGDNEVNVDDLLEVLAKWGDCDPEAAPLAGYDEALADAGISEQEYYDYLDIMANGTQEQQDCWHCWFTYRLQCWNSPCPPASCGCSDPFAGT